MSFDTFLVRFEHGEAAPVQKDSVLRVLRTLSYTGPDEFGFYVVRFPDETQVEFSAGELESDEPMTGCSFFVRVYWSERPGAWANWQRFPDGVRSCQTTGSDRMAKPTPPRRRCPSRRSRSSSTSSATA